MREVFQRSAVITVDQNGEVGSMELCAFVEVSYDAREWELTRIPRSMQEDPAHDPLVQSLKVPSNEEFYFHCREQLEYNPIPFSNAAMMLALGVPAKISGEEIPIIAAPRGLPKDLSKRLQSFAEKGKLGTDHHSFVLLSEIKAYNWERAFRTWADLVRYIRADLIPPLEELRVNDDDLSVRIVFGVMP